MRWRSSSSPTQPDRCVSPPGQCTPSSRFRSRHASQPVLLHTPGIRLWQDSPPRDVLGRSSPPLRRPATLPDTLPATPAPEVGRCFSPVPRLSSAVPLSGGQCVSPPLQMSVALPAIPRPPQPGGSDAPMENLESWGPSSVPAAFSHTTHEVELDPKFQFASCDALGAERAGQNSEPSSSWEDAAEELRQHMATAHAGAGLADSLEARTKKEKEYHGAYLLTCIRARLSTLVTDHHTLTALRYASSRHPPLAPPPGCWLQAARSEYLRLCAVLTGSCKWPSIPTSAAYLAVAVRVPVREPQQQ